MLKFLSLLLPWKLRRRALQRWFKYDIHPGAKIGYAWIFPGKLVMKEGAVIDHFTVAIHLDKIEMGVKSIIGRGNWITGLSVNNDLPHFKHQQDRRAELILGDHSAITKKHHLDCTNLIQIGTHSTIAGYASQFLTHSIDVVENRQHSTPIYIGNYTFVGTNAVVLGGSTLPDYSVLGAKALLNKQFTKEWTLYGGVPARAISEIPKTAKYFSRPEGFVY